MKILITHIRNEEYYLKWWLPHHKDKFDLGVIIDYHSTDNTHNIIKQYCPEWMIVPSRHEDFDSLHLDAQVTDIEKMLWKTFPNAWIITLTVTEFLIGDLSFLDDINKDTCFYLSQTPMIDTRDQIDTPADPNIPLHKQRTYGITWNENQTNLNSRGARVLRNYNHADYPIGRHWPNITEERICKEAAILWYGFSPYTKEMRQRHEGVSKLMSVHDQINNRSATHNPDVRSFLIRRYQRYIKDQSDFISQFES